MDSKGKPRFVGTAGLSASQSFGCVCESRFIYPPCNPHFLRTYPRGFASKLLEALETHLGNAGEGRRDLRFKPQLSPVLSELEQFQQLSMGDPWEDANMLELLRYLMTSKKVRTELDQNTSSPCSN